MTINNGSELQVKPRIVIEKGQFSIREVYFRADGSIESWTLKPVYLEGESIVDLAEYYKWVGIALRESVLKYNQDGKLERAPEARAGSAA
jgi:hypothetical protein